MALGIGAIAETIDTIPMIHDIIPVKIMRYKAHWTILEKGLYLSPICHWD